MLHETDGFLEGGICQSSTRQEEIQSHGTIFIFNVQYLSLIVTLLNCTRALYNFIDTSFCKVKILFKFFNIV